MQPRSARFRVGLLFSAVVVLAAPAMALLAQSPTDSFDGHRRHERPDVRMRLGGDIHIAAGEHVGQEVVAVFGSVRVDGEVDGDVVAVGGHVHLGEHAIVRGLTTAVGGRIHADPGARPLGGRTEVAWMWPPEWTGTADAAAFRVPWPSREWWAGSALLFTGLRLGLIGLFGLIAVLLGGGLFGRASRRIAAAPWTSTAVGAGAQLLVAPLFAVVTAALVFSVVGLPLVALMPVLALLLAAVWLVGFAAVAAQIGHRLLSRVDAQPNPVASYAVGFITITMVTWVAAIGWWSGLLGGVPAFAVATLGFLIEGGVWAAALGAIVLALAESVNVSGSSTVPPPLETAPV